MNAMSTIQTWSRLFDPAELGLVVIFLAALVFLAVGLLRRRESLGHYIPLQAFLMVSAVLIRFWEPMAWFIRSVVLASAGGMLFLHFRRREFSRDEPSNRSDNLKGADFGSFVPSIGDPFQPPAAGADLMEQSSAAGRGRRRLVGRVLVSIPMVLSAVLLLHRLGTFAGHLLAWESPVVEHGFVPAIDDDVGFWRFLGDRFLWTDGLLSAGQHSLFYGPSTLLLFRWFGANPWTLRISSVAATLLALWILYRFARRFYGPTVGVTVMLTLALSSPVLFYGRYGSSNAGTLLSSALAIYATWSFLQAKPGAWLRALVCAFALCVGTLQYAPGRLVVLFLLGAIPLALLLDRRVRSASHIAGVALIVVIGMGFWGFQVHHERHGVFLHARGEQIFGLIRNPSAIPGLIGTRKEFESGSMDTATQISLAVEVLKKTSGELADLVLPDIDRPSAGAILRFDPPLMPLYFAPLAVFAVIGIARALADWRSWRHLAPILLAVSYCSVLLMTNRVDPHRAFMLVIPFSLFVGWGVDEVAAAARALKVPWGVAGALAVALSATALFADLVQRQTHWERPNPVALELSAEMADIPGRTKFWFARDHRELTWLALQNLDRSIERGVSAGGILAQAVSNGLRADVGGTRRLALREAKIIARTGTLVLGPRGYFRDAARYLQQEGLRVIERNAHGFRYYRIDGGKRVSGIDGRGIGEIAVLESVPTPVPVVLTEGRRAYLSDLEPISSSYGFEPPRMDATWNGRPVQMAGRSYAKAIGTHAWTTLIFKVPPNAIAFQSWVGLSDEARGCEQASVEFVVRGMHGRELWRSPVIEFSSPPQAVEVPLGDHKRITLETTEADDGRDCDHANWGEPAFLMPAK